MGLSIDVGALEVGYWMNEGFPNRPSAEQVKVVLTEVHEDLQEDILVLGRM